MQIKPQLITSNVVSSASFKRSNLKGLWPILPLFSLVLDAQGKNIIYTYAERCKYRSELLIWGKMLKCVFQTELKDLSHFCQHSQLGNFIGVLLLLFCCVLVFFLDMSRYLNSTVSSSFYFHFVFCFPLVIEKNTFHIT